MSTTAMSLQFQSTPVSERKGSSIKDVCTERRGTVESKADKSRKAGWLDFTQTQTSKFSVGLPTSDFVNSGHLHLTHQY